MKFNITKHCKNRYIGTSRNELFEENEDYLLIFEEWLEDYTSHNFNV